MGIVGKDPEAGAFEEYILTPTDTAPTMPPFWLLAAFTLWMWR